MSENPRVGLVMAAYNATAYLEEAVEAVMKQDFTDFSCRIVDDGSTDGTADLARRLTTDDSRFSVEEVVHGGQSTARNFGVSQLPMTEYLSFPDADDVWRPDALSSLIDAADAFDGVGAHALGDWIDSDGNPFGDGEFARWGRQRFTVRRFRKHLLALDQPSDFDSLLWSCTVYPPGLWILRRDTFDRVGGFDPSLPHYEDWDLQIRASRLGDFAFFNKIIVYYRQHPTQVTANHGGDYAITPLRDKTVRSPLNTPHQRKEASSAWRAHELRNAVKSASVILRDPKHVLKHFRHTASYLVRSVAGPARTHPYNSGSDPG